MDTFKEKIDATAIKDLVEITTGVVGSGDGLNIKEIIEVVEAEVETLNSDISLYKEMISSSNIDNDFNITNDSNLITDVVQINYLRYCLKQAINDESFKKEDRKLYTTMLADSNIPMMYDLLNIFKTLKDKEEYSFEKFKELETERLEKLGKIEYLPESFFESKNNIEKEVSNKSNEFLITFIDIDCVSNKNKKGGSTKVN